MTVIASGKKNTPTPGGSGKTPHRTVHEIQDSKKRMIAQTGVFVFFITLFMSIVVWDMRKVAMISEVIHDDHTQLWEHMNETSLKQWLSPLDLCLLQGVKEPSIDITYFRAKNCTKAFQQVTTSSPSGSTISPGSQRLFCNVGASLGKVCPGPLSTRSFFRSRLKHPHYSDANNRHLSLALRHLAKHNMPLILIGDGISKQNQDAIICDLMRTDKVIITSGTNAGSGTKNPNDYSYFTDYSVRWKDEKLKLDIRYYKVFHIEDDPSHGEGDDEDGSNFFDFEFKFDFFGFSKSQKNRRERERRHSRRLTSVPFVVSTAAPISTAMTTQQTQTKSVATIPIRTIHGFSNGTDRTRRPNKHIANTTSALVFERDRLRKPKNATIKSEHQTTPSNSDINLTKIKKGRDRELNGTVFRDNRVRGKGFNATTSTMKASSSMMGKNVSLPKVPRRPLENKIAAPGSASSVTKQVRSLAINGSVASLLTPPVSNKTVSTGVVSNSTSNTGIVLPRYSFQQIKEVINDFITSTNRSVAIIANAGVWYNSREQFRRELPTLLSWLDNLAKDKDHHHMIFYRETAAQHWNHTINGYYDREYKQKEDNNGTCVPIEDNTPELDWRNTDVYNAITNEGYEHIKVIPFHEITMPLYNMHPTSASSQDCTHFCYFPQMWQPVWFELYNATLSMQR